MEILNDNDIKEYNEKWEMVKCPFCFSKFSPFGAHFRSETGYTSMDEKKGLTDEQMKYVVKKDEKLYRYNGNELLYPPMLHWASDADGNVIVSRKYELDDAGFPSAMYDTLGNSTKQRCCPCCHNSLPEKYGKFPVVFIAVLGITKSGKTVYLSQLLKNISRYLTQSGFSISVTPEELNKFVEDHPVRKSTGTEGYKLPDNTSEVLPQPIPLTIENNKTHEIYTIVFYDIAGEDCVKPSKMDKYGPFIKNANAFLMIIDPMQFSDLWELEKKEGNKSEAEQFKPEQIVQTMYTSFLSDKSEICTVPLAVSFSKSDVLWPYFNKHGFGHNLLSNINYEKLQNKCGLSMNDHQELSATIERILIHDETQVGKSFVNTIKNRFSNIGYFAFSALNVAPIVRTVGSEKQYYLNAEPVCVRVEEPLLWLLYKIGITQAIRMKKEKKIRLFGENEYITVVTEERNNFENIVKEKSGGKKRISR